MAGLPTLDCSGFSHKSDEDRVEFCKALVESFRDHGFVKLINTGIDDKTTSALLDWVCSSYWIVDISLVKG